MGIRRVVAVGGRAVALMLACTAPAVALDPHKALTQYVHNAWQTDEGLPQNSVQALLQTRDGYLWFGTQEGLVRFDGEHFEIFDRSNTKALASNDVTALLEDRLGTLWVGTNGGGLTLLKDGVFTRFSAQNSLSDEFVTALREDSRGTMWIGTRDHGLFGFADGRVRSVTAKDGLSSNRVFAIYEDRGGDLWVGTSDGLNRLRGRNIVRFSTADGLVNPRIMAIAGDATGALWIGTDAGVNRFVDGRVSGAAIVPGTAIRSLLVDRDRNLWIGGRGAGLSRLAGGRLTTITANDGLSNNTPLSLVEDRERNLWVGTNGGGLNRFRDGSITTYASQEGLSSDVAISVYEDRRGNLWFGTIDGLNRMAKDGSITIYKTEDGLSNIRATSVYEDRAGDIWVATVGGLNRLRSGEFQRFTTRDGLASDTLTVVQGDRSGALWIGTDGAGLNRFENGRFTTFTTADGLTSNSVTSLREDRSGNLWIGTRGWRAHAVVEGPLHAVHHQAGPLEQYRHLDLRGQRGRPLDRDQRWRAQPVQGQPLYHVRHQGRVFRRSRASGAGRRPGQLVDVIEQGHLSSAQAATQRVRRRNRDNNPGQDVRPGRRHEEQRVQRDRPAGRIPDARRPPLVSHAQGRGDDRPGAPAAQPPPASGDHRTGARGQGAGARDRTGEHPAGAGRTGVPVFGAQPCRHEPEPLQVPAGGLRPTLAGDEPAKPVLHQHSGGQLHVPRRRQQQRRRLERDRRRVRLPAPAALLSTMVVLFGARAGLRRTPLRRPSGPRRAPACARPRARPSSRGPDQGAHDRGGSTPSS